MGEEIRLWPSAPRALGTEPEDQPAVFLHRPAAGRANGTAVVVCPGGGYGHLAMGHEGADVARWLTDRGVTALVLRYRIAPKYRHPVPLLDVSRALRLVRTRAGEWGVDPQRIGVWGFSAGGHLAATVSTHYDAGDARAGDPIDRVSSRPDFAVLAYPVITFRGDAAHNGSRRNLLGESPSPELVESLSNETQVTDRTPPTFLFHTADDAGVPVENSLLYFQALREHDVPAELHAYAHGRHGVGLAPGDAVLSSWPNRLRDWLAGRGLLPEAKPAEQAP